MATMILKNNWFKTEDMGGDIVDFVRNHEDLTSMGRMHKCVSSADLVLKFRERAENLGLTLGKETAGLEKRGKKFMYLAEVKDDSHKDYALTLGFRNFSDKTLSYSSIAGSNVFLCCNGVCNSICKDGKMRHTIGNVDRNLIDSKIDIAFNQFINDKDRIHEQIAMMKNTTLTDEYNAIKSAQKVFASLGDENTAVSKIKSVVNNNATETSNNTTNISKF